MYLLWGILAPIGFVATHFHQQHSINYLWTVIALIGLGFMYKTMPLRVSQMRKIFLAWLVPIVMGIAVSGVLFYVHGHLAAVLLAHLGAFWLMVLAVGYFLTGLVDPPSMWYWVAVVLNVAAGVLCFTVASATEVQFLIAAIVTAISMFSLWLFRSESW